MESKPFMVFLCRSNKLIREDQKMYDKLWDQVVKDDDGDDEERGSHKGDLGFLQLLIDTTGFGHECHDRRVRRDICRQLKRPLQSKEFCQGSVSSSNVVSTSRPSSCFPLGF